MHQPSDESAADRGLCSCMAADFYREIADGLHAMAQPLTVLRSTVEVLALPGAVINRERYLNLSAEHLDRTCSLFSSLQSLMAARLLEARRVCLDFWQVVAPVLRDCDVTLRPAGIGLAVVADSSVQRFCGDAERTEQAFAAILRVTAALASRGDVLEISAEQSGGFVTVTVQNAREHGKRIDSSQRLSLSLARANILSQQGRFQLVEDPMRAIIALPLDDLGPIDCDRNRFGSAAN
jgi:hypothetical protein